MKPRAPQNAVLELGFFIGYLGRDKVAVLYDQAVELPSDMRGVEYINLGGNWKHDLAVELEAAGIDTKLS
jgi:predicted nucleotide-binding protein